MRPHPFLTVIFRAFENLNTIPQNGLLTFRMDESIINLLEELSLRATTYNSASEDDGVGSNISSPTYEHTSGTPIEESVELKNAVNSIFANDDSGYDKSKMLAALLGNLDLVTIAVKKIKETVAVGKKMEHIYRIYYVNPKIDLDLNEINHLIRTFTELYDGESYVREVNISRVYQAYCKKLTEIYESRTNTSVNDDDSMML